MRAYLAMLAAGFRRQATYRAALVGGLGANVFWGVVRTAVFASLYTGGARVAGLAEGEALTYVWVGQSMFGVVFVNWGLELPERIRSGDFAVGMIRPGHPYLRELAFDLGRNLSQMTIRSTLPLAGAALLLPLVLPTTPGRWAALAVSGVLAAVVGFQVRYLVFSSAFWTADFRFVSNLFYSWFWFGSGFVIPTAYFPDPLRQIAEASPLDAMLMTPFRVAIGSPVWAELGRQAVWIGVLGAAGLALTAVARRRVEVHGG
jgi:ABC-2 type transport system permease protein